MRYSIPTLVAGAVIVIAVAVILASGSGHRTSSTTVQSTTQNQISSVYVSSSTSVPTTVPSQSSPSTYYFLAPTSLSSLENVNSYSIVANYTLTSQSTGLLGGTQTSSGTLHFSNNPSASTQSFATVTVPSGNTTMQLTFTSFNLQVNGHSYTVTPMTSSESLTKQNFQITAQNTGYNLTIGLNYIGGNNFSYYYSGTSGVSICFRPVVSAIAGSYFVTPSNFSIETPGQDSC